jgi:hypothetical protein
VRWWWERGVGNFSEMRYWLIEMDVDGALFEMMMMMKNRGVM